MTITIVTVHGTFADRASDEGDAWWQKDSAFACALAARLTHNVKLVPFHWNGRNSEPDRRAAGDALFALLLREIENSQSPIFVIAHSHGGNVVAHALDNFPYCERKARREPLAMKQLTKEWFRRNYVNMKKASSAGRIAGWITVGTPFLRFGPRPNLTSVTYHLSTIRIAVFGLVLIGAALLLPGRWNEAVGFYPFLIGCGALFWAFGRLLDIGSPRTTVSMNRGVSADLLIKRWFGISSRADEAIWSLRLCVAQQLVVPGHMISGHVALIMQLTLDCILLTLIAYLVAPLLMDPKPFLVSKDIVLTWRFVSLGAVTAIYLFARHIVHSVTKRWLEPLCGRFLTKLFGAVVKGSAFGVDTAAIVPVGVEVQPEGARSECWTLDDGADERLLAGVRSDRERFISLAYSSIRDANENGAIVDVALGDPFLVHNKYFGEETVLLKLSEFIEQSNRLPQISGLEDEAERLYQEYVNW